MGSSPTQPPTREDLETRSPGGGGEHLHHDPREEPRDEHVHHFGAFTILDLDRVRRSAPDAAVPIAAGIFLDVFSVLLLVLDLFGGRRD